MLSAFTILLITLTVVFYIYTKCVTYNYWRRKKIPSLNPTFLLGDIASCIFSRSSLGQHNLKVYNHFKQNGFQYGGCYVFTTPVFVPISLEMIKNILKNDFDHFENRSITINKDHDPFSEHVVFMKGLEWKNLRKKITPTFTSKKLKDMIPLIIECCDVLTDDIKNNQKDGVFVFEKMKKLSLDIIGSTVFGINCNNLQNPDNEFYKTFTSFTNKTVDSTCAMLFLLMYSDILNTFKIPLTSKELRGVLKNILMETTTFRLENNVKRNDFLNLLMELMSDSEDGITFDQLVAQSFSFIVAGYETVTSTLTFCLLEVAQNKYIYDKLMVEINEELEKNDGNINYDSIKGMKYLKMVIQETLRKYSFCSAVFRKCNKDYKIPNTNKIIEKGTHVWIPIIGVHNDPDYYPDPEKFDPERFNPENINKHPYTFLAFGEGPRICMGVRSSYIQLKVILVTLLTNFYILPAFKTKRLPRTILNKSGMFVTPRSDIKIVFQAIK